MEDCDVMLQWLAEDRVCYAVVYATGPYVLVVCDRV